MTQADAHVVVGEREGAASSEASDGAVSLLGCVSGAARRRWERRLRSFGRLAALQCKIAITTAFHHSALPGHGVVAKVGVPEGSVRSLNSAYDNLRASQGPWCVTLIRTWRGVDSVSVTH